MEWRAAKEHWIAEAKAAEERCIAEARVAEECRAAEAKVQEEERSRAQAEALRQQKLLAALEVKRKAKEVASRSGSGPKGGLKHVGAPEKGKEVERVSCDHYTAQGVVCEVSLVFVFQSFPN